jgi:hypothetical protein
MRKLPADLFLLATPMLAQNAIYVFPPAPRIPAGGIQSITAVVTGNANKTVNWSTNCGKLIGRGNTIGLKSLSIGTYTVTGTMAADGTTAAASVVTFEAGFAPIYKQPPRIPASACADLQCSGHREHYDSGGNTDNGYARQSLTVSMA